jgi:hypothetical protein
VGSGRLMGVAGWEAFVHGVFAITITLLVSTARSRGRADTIQLSVRIVALHPTRQLAVAN